MITFRKATRHGVCALSQKLLTLLENKDSQIYKENVVRFGIPEEYVKRAFSEERMLEAAASGKSTFYLALKNRCQILGFAQIIQQDASTAELDRIVVFPEYTRQGIGTQLLAKVLRDQKHKGTRIVVVNTGKEETHARRFYEKNSFKQAEEATIDAPWGNRLSLVTYKLELKKKG